MVKKAGIRFNQEDYILVDMESKKITETTPEGEMEYAIGSGLEYKTLYTNPNPAEQMSTATLFQEGEILGYDYLIFTVTDVANTYEVKEWCEIEPLKAHGGQFVISMPLSNALYCRKVYRSSGAVKPSAAVYDIGKTTENRDACIIKSVECVKGVR